MTARSAVSATARVADAVRRAAMGRVRVAVASVAATRIVRQARVRERVRPGRVRAVIAGLVPLGRGGQLAKGDRAEISAGTTVAATAVATNILKSRCRCRS